MTQYVLSLSYGKDSLACLGAIEKLGLPLDRIVHAEVWATDTIPADLPPMVEFKKKADAIIKERWGITVEHIYATKPRERERERRSATQTCSTNLTIAPNTENTSTGSQKSEVAGASGSNTAEKMTYEDIFYRPLKSPKKKKGGGQQNLRLPDAQGKLVYERSQATGFATKWSQYCTGELKSTVFRDLQKWDERHGAQEPSRSNRNSFPIAP